MPSDSFGFGCSYFSPDGDCCTVHDAEEDMGAQAGPVLTAPCEPDQCPLLEDLMLGGDLFSG